MEAFGGSGGSVFPTASAGATDTAPATAGTGSAVAATAAGDQDSPAALIDRSIGRLARPLGYLNTIDRNPAVAVERSPLHR